MTSPMKAELERVTQSTNSASSAIGDILQQVLRNLSFPCKGTFLKSFSFLLAKLIISLLDEEDEVEKEENVSKGNKHTKKKKSYKREFFVSLSSFSS